jgi:hypothetical protein
VSATNIIITVVLALAANTSFGGLPVLMSLLSGDDRLPHLFGLRAERPVHRYGVAALAVLAAVLLIAVNADTARLIPLYAIGVFTGFTISQTGLVRHWHSQRTPRWMPRAALNGTGAILTATATVVFVVTKFMSGAWVVVLAVPALMLLFSRIQDYYQAVGAELDLGQLPQRPLPAGSLMIVPVGSISKLTQLALHAALSLGDDVIAVSVCPEAGGVDVLGGNKVSLADQRRVRGLAGNHPAVGQVPPLHALVPQADIGRVDEILIGALPVPHLTPGVPGVGQNRGDRAQRPRSAGTVWVPLRVSC